MTLTLDIAHASVATRLIGDAADAGRVDRALQSLLETRVLPDVAAQMDKALSEDAILCVPRLPLAVSLTLEEALSGQSGDDWVAALVAALSSALRDQSNAMQFENQSAFLLGYMRMRLGLIRADALVFSGFERFDLMSPLQAVAELLRMSPEAWVSLAELAADEQTAFIRALASQGGPTAVAQVIAASCADTGDTTRAPDLVALFDWAAESVARDVFKKAFAERPASNDLVQTAMRAALGFAAVGRAQHAALLGCLIVLMRRAGMPHGPKPHNATILSDLRRTVVDFPVVLRGVLDSLLTRVAADPHAAKSLVRLAQKNSDGQSDTPAPDNRTAPAEPETARADPSDQAATGTDVIWSSIAGLGLLLPFMNENHIGAKFPAHLRLAALGSLAADGPVQEPETDALLLAICGMDDATETPERPNAMDMLFVAPDRKAGIEAAAAGAARFAHWLEARFVASLPGLGASSRAFLQAQFLLRPGRLIQSETALRLELETPPLGAVLGLSGLIGEDLCRVPWLEDRTLSIALIEVAP